MNILCPATPHVILGQSGRVRIVKVKPFLLKAFFGVLIYTHISRLNFCINNYHICPAVDRIPSTYGVSIIQKWKHFVAIPIAGRRAALAVYDKAPQTCPNPHQSYIAGPRQVQASCTVPAVPTQEAILEEGGYKKTYHISMINLLLASHLNAFKTINLFHRS